MNTLIIEVSPEIYAVLSTQAKAHGKAPTEYSRELIETGIRRSAEKSTRSAREILEAAGMVRTLGDELMGLIDDDVPPLEEVIEILTAAGGPSLTEILDEQRGPKPWHITS